ncbi:MAG: HEAT repeat domain-containing protein [Cyanothece sp. SIO2G6]|nr:HEAT repeat domain-containing protein [Cyanothece sp. SIO2G6]
MLDNLLPTLLVVLSCWAEVPVLAQGLVQDSGTAIDVSATSTTVATVLQPFPTATQPIILGQTGNVNPSENLSQVDDTSFFWPLIFISVASGLGVGIAVYCLSSSQQPASRLHRRGMGATASDETPANAAPLLLSSTGKKRRDSKLSKNPKSKNPRSNTQPKKAIAHPHISSPPHPLTPAPPHPSTPELSVTKIKRMDTLLEHLRSRDAQTRRQAIWELGQQGTSEAIQPLVDMMTEVDSQQRSLILAAIAEIGTRTLSPINRALMISLQDAHADVRKNAIRDLTRVYTLMAQMSQILTHAATDDDEEVQATALWALEQFNRISSTPNLLALESMAARSPHLPSHRKTLEERS